MIHRVYRGLLNFMFHLHLKNYTHSVLCRVEDARRFEIRTRSYAYQSEQLIKLIKSGATYVEVGVIDCFDNEARSSKAFRARNILGVTAFVFHVFFDVYVRGEALKRRRQ